MDGYTSICNICKLDLRTDSTYQSVVQKCSVDVKSKFPSLQDTWSVFLSLLQHQEYQWMRPNVTDDPRPCKSCLNLIVNLIRSVVELVRAVKVGIDKKRKFSSGFLSKEKYEYVEGSEKCDNIKYEDEYVEGNYECDSDNIKHEEEYVQGNDNSDNIKYDKSNENGNFKIDNLETGGDGSLTLSDISGDDISITSSAISVVDITSSDSDFSLDMTDNLPEEEETQKFDYINQSSDLSQLRQKKDQLEKSLDDNKTPSDISALNRKKDQLEKSLELCSHLPDGGDKVRRKLAECKQKIKYFLSERTPNEKLEKTLDDDDLTPSNLSQLRQKKDKLEKSLDDDITPTDISQLRRKKNQLEKSLELCSHLPDGGDKVRTKLAECKRKIKYFLSERTPNEKCPTQGIECDHKIETELTFNDSFTREKKNKSVLKQMKYNFDQKSDNLNRISKLKRKKKYNREKRTDSLDSLPKLSWKRCEQKGELTLGFNII